MRVSKVGASVIQSAGRKIGIAGATHAVVRPCQVLLGGSLAVAG